MANPVPLHLPARLSIRRQALPLSLLALVLAGCAQTPAPLDPSVLVPPPTPPVRKGAPAASAASPAATKPAASDAASLAPLATPQQVVGSVDLGRLDPFGALIPRLPTLLGPDGKPLPVNLAGGPGAGAGGASGAAGAGAKSGGGASAAGGSGGRGAAPLAPLTLPSGFSVSGVIRSGGLSEAVVSYGALSGSLRPGDRGGRTTDLLPPGWSVAAIDVNRGLITLQKDGRRVSAEL